MSCRICGRNSCTESFHSCEEQEKFDEINEKWIDKINELKDEIINLKIENNIYWNLLSNEQRDKAIDLLNDL